MKKSFIILFAVLLLFFSCDNKKQVNLLKVDEIESSFQSEIKKYVFYGKLGETYIKKESKVPTFIVLLTESGLWNVYIEAYGAEGNLIAKSDSRDIEILPDKENGATFQLKAIIEKPIHLLNVNVTKTQFESDIKKYVFNGTSDGTYIRKESKVPTFTVLLEDGGLWSMYVEAYGENENLIAKSDSRDIEILPYEEKDVTFQLKEGNGTFNFKLSIPKDVMTMDKILCTLSSTEEISEEIKFEFDFKADGTINGAYKMFTKSLNLPAITYDLEVKTTNILGDDYGIPITDSVDILTNKTKDYEHICDISDFPHQWITINNGSEYFPGYLYISKSSKDMRVYCSFDNGEYVDITDKIQNNYVSFADSKYSNLKIVASSDLSKWARGDSYVELSSTGPAGGIVFYDCDADNKYGNGDGLTSSECNWRYLEAAPENLPGKYIFGYYYSSSAHGSLETITGKVLGDGSKNTDKLVAKMAMKAKISLTADGFTDLYAARAANLYSLNGYRDWFLPSRDELYSMYTVKKHIDNFPTDYCYWSSSENGYDSVVSLSFDKGIEYSKSCEEQYYVRPIRAFDD